MLTRAASSPLLSAPSFATVFGTGRGSPAMQAARDRREQTFAELADADGLGGRLAGLLVMRIAQELLVAADAGGRYGVEVVSTAGERGTYGVSYKRPVHRPGRPPALERVDWDLPAAVLIGLGEHFKQRAGIRPFSPLADEHGRPAGPNKSHGVFATVINGRPARVTVMASRHAFGHERVQLGFELPSLHALGFSGASGL